jgi:predicted PurR-regulated permease PerM
MRTPAAQPGKPVPGTPGPTQPGSTPAGTPAIEPVPPQTGPLRPQPLSDLGRRVVIVLLVVASVYLVVRLRGIVTLVLLSLLLAYVLEPAVSGLQWLSFRLFGRPLPRWAAILSVFIWLASLLALAGWFLVPLLVEQTVGLGKRLPEYYDQVRGIVEDLRRMSRTELPPRWWQTIEAYFAEIGGMAVSFLQTSVVWIFTLLASLLAVFLVPIITYFMLLAAPGIRPRILAWFSPRLRPEVDFLVGEVNVVMYKFLRGRLIVSVIVGALIAAGTFLVGLPYSLLLGLTAGLLDLIPFVGPFIAAVPAIVLALLESPGKVLLVVVLYTAVQQLEQIVLSPKIEGGELELNAGVVIVAATAAGTLFGLLGVLLAIPITALGRILLLYIRAKLRGEPLRGLGEQAAAEEGAS